MTMLFRRYREFDELHSRLTLCFPSDNLPNFPGKTFLPGKSRARETVEKRLVDLNKYISQLLDLEASISEVINYEISTTVTIYKCREGERERES